MMTGDEPEAVLRPVHPIPLSYPSRRARKPIGLKSTISLPSAAHDLPYRTVSGALQR
jgi:hypothetical protein